MKKQTKVSGLIDAINESITIAKERKIVHQFTQDYSFNGRTINLNGNDVVNFGSCSYLGLEMDPRIIEASQLAVGRYGSQFSSSRTYVSFTLYEELESLLQTIFGSNVLLSTCSTLGHQAVIPIVVGDSDAVIFDHQAHISMQDLSAKLKVREIPTFLLRHSRLDELETKIIDLSQRHEKVWYFIDGVYSMYGDFAPMKELVALMNKYRNFYLYVDDAHGMSWAGKHGAGYALSQVSLHPKMILCSSLAKGFASAGGVFVIPDSDLFNRVKNWGGPLTYSGPQQPAVIGASVASAKIHLTDEIYELQNQLMDNISFCNEVLNYHQLPVISNSGSPIFFVGLGLPKVGYNMVHRMLMDGYYVNLGIFPAVSETCTGMRFTINRQHSRDDIEQMVGKIAKHLPLALAEEGRSEEDIFRAFKIKPNRPKSASKNSGLNINVYNSIRQIDKKLWNDRMEIHGAFDWNYLAILEESFSNNSDLENNWNFFYYVVLNEANEVVLMTFFTDCLMKDDMLASESISAEIEKKRISDKYYLSTRVFMMGSLLTNGDHLFVDRSLMYWKEALMSLLDRVWIDQESVGAQTLFLRDFDRMDKEFTSFFIDRGFVHIPMPEKNIIADIDLTSREAYLAQFHSKKRSKLHKEAIQFETFFQIKLNGSPSDAEVLHYYELYKGVKANNLSINDFNLPFKLFENIAKNEQWEIIELFVTEEKNPIGVVLSYKNINYCPVMLGMNYNYIEKYQLYKQILFQVTLRAIELGVSCIHLGVTASDQKRKFGAKQIQQVGYVQSKDNFNQSVLHLLGQN